MEMEERGRLSLPMGCVTMRCRIWREESKLEKRYTGEYIGTLGWGSRIRLVWLECGVFWVCVHIVEAGKIG